MEMDKFLCVGAGVGFKVFGLSSSGYNGLSCNVVQTMEVSYWKEFGSIKGHSLLLANAS